MEQEFRAIRAYLEENDLDGYLIEDSAANADQRYLSGFGSVDPFASLWTAGDLHLLVRSLDRELAMEQSRATTVSSGADYDRDERVERYGLREADQRVLAAFLRDHSVEGVAVPQRFPLGLADALRSGGFDVHPETEGVIAGIRAVKTEKEIDNIRETQRATESAMRRAEALLRSAAVEDGLLTSNGESLTSERVKREIEVSLVREGCALEETIVAGGAAAAKPHDRGSGPLSAGMPIVIDIFPRHRESKYHADMTRTFCVGEPDETAAEWYALTREAQQVAFEVIEPGRKGEEVHDAVCDVYEAADIPTARSDEGTETGFIHGTGHGIGLEVHERPRVSSNGEELQVGHVITIEPGVYDPAVGGIRIEDLVVVTDEGFENLTDYEKSFVV